MLDERIDELINDKIVLYVLCPAIVWALAGAEWLLQIRHAPRSPITFAVFAALLSLYSGARIWMLTREIAALKLGRDGEIWVGQYLDRLRETGARVFHDVPAKGFNLDHVLVGSKGIFVLETKTWSKKRGHRIRVVDGRLQKNGFAVDPNPVDQAIAEAAWLANLLKESTGKYFAVWPVVLFPTWYVEQDEKTKAKVWALEPKMLPGYLDREPGRLTDGDVNLASFHLDRYIRAG